jgi:hypothetical protein
MSRTARSTIKSQRGKLARFAASKVFMQSKPNATKVYMPPLSAAVTTFPFRDVRAGSCLVQRAAR